ncbi:MAG: aminopeptidase, partial [Planctomycetota bacterium]
MPDLQSIPRPKLITRKAVIRLGVAAILLAVLAPWAWWSMIRMPGESYRGDLPPLTGAQAALSAELKQHVEALAGGIGERNVIRYRNLVAACEFIERELAAYGYTVE